MTASTCEGYRQYYWLPLVVIAMAAGYCCDFAILYNVCIHTSIHVYVELALVVYAKSYYT